MSALDDLIKLLTLEQIEAAVCYIDENRDQVMATHRQIDDRLKRGNPPEIEARARAGRARMEALRETLSTKGKEMVCEGASS